MLAHEIVKDGDIEFLETMSMLTEGDRFQVVSLIYFLANAKDQKPGPCLLLEES